MARPTYKAGDRVVCVCNDPLTSIKIGALGTVNAIPTIGGRSVYPDPRKFLVYVDWDEHLGVGVPRGNVARVSALPIRCYDNGGATTDRYTVIYTEPNGNARGDRWFDYIGMSEHPTHPQGIGQHGELTPEQFVKYAWTGDKRIDFEALPAECRRVVLRDIY